MEIKDVVRLLKSEMIPAMGCTEPAASALAGAKARELIGEDRIKSVAVFASRDIVKNAMGVGIPDCERRGILTAVALGNCQGRIRIHSSIKRGMVSLHTRILNLKGLSSPIFLKPIRLQDVAFRD